MPNLLSEEDVLPACLCRLPGIGRASWLSQNSHRFEASRIRETPNGAAIFRLRRDLRTFSLQADFGLQLRFHLGERSLGAVEWRIAFQAVPARLPGIIRLKICQPGWLTSIDPGHATQDPFTQGSSGPRAV